MSGVNGKSEAAEDKTATREIFLKDLEIFEESIRKNEEIGEKRFEFFLTLVTAVAAGLIALWTSDRARDPKDVQPLTEAALLALLAFGLISFWRMVHRDKVTVEYKRTTHDIRRRYRAAFPEVADYKLEHELKAEDREGLSDWEKRGSRIKQMGFTQTLAVVNGLLLMGAEWNAGFHPLIWVSSGLVFAGALMVAGADPHDKENEKTAPRAAQK
jgi:hypothetical protein